MTLNKYVSVNPAPNFISQRWNGHLRQLQRHQQCLSPLMKVELVHAVLQTCASETVTFALNTSVIT